MLKIGAKITALRKAKGWTQEQLALALGISSPAVSKWETDNSYPDITLLCPLARALDTNVDTLLSFEEELPADAVVQRINEIVETARTKDVKEAEEALEELLHQYPASIPIKYNAVGAYSIFEMLFPLSAQEKKEEWKRKKKKLLEDIYANGTGAYWQSAVSVLASMALADDELDRAEALLNELPKNDGDPTFLWAFLYQKRDDNEKAVEVTQKRLYQLVHQAQSCLAVLMSEKTEPDTARALEICRIYQKVEELFGCGGMSDGFFLELYLRAGQKEKALDSLCRFVEAYTKPVPLPNQLLFSKAFHPREGQHYSKEMRKILLDRILEESDLDGLRDSGEFQAAIKKLKESLEVQ